MLQGKQTVKLVVVSLMIGFSHAVWAAPCGVPDFVDPGAVALDDKSVLIVTHPSTQWDGRFASKLGMDAAVSD